MILQNLNLVKSKVNKIIEIKQPKIKPKIIVVTKTFTLEKIKPLLENGHMHFGENKIQEAEAKWSDVKKNYGELKLHMLGKLQTNKTKRAVKLFDYIHSLDSKKLAEKISFYQRELNKKIKLFIQVNLGDEEQKTGISLNALENFYTYCTKELGLNVVGLMCLPPINSDPKKYFLILKNYSKKLNLEDISMGMSSDYEEAVLHGSTYLRLGRIILGER